MLNCQSCQTRLVIYSSQLDHSLQQLQDILSEDIDNVIPDYLKVDFILQKQLRTISPDVYITQTPTIPSQTTIMTNFSKNLSQNSSNFTSLSGPQNFPQNFSQNHENLPLSYYGSNNLLLNGNLIQQPESNQALIPDDGSLSLSIIEQRITKVSKLLSILTNLSLLHHPLCPKCCHDLNLKLIKFCEKLDTDLEDLLKTQLDFFKISFFNELHSSIPKPQTLPIDTNLHYQSNTTIDSVLDKFLEQKNFQNQQQNFPHHQQQNSKKPLLSHPNSLQSYETADDLLNNQILDLYNEEQCLKNELDELNSELFFLQEEENELHQYTAYISQLEDNFMSTLLDMKQSISQYLILTRTVKSKLQQQQTIHNSLTLTSPIFDLMTIDLNSPIPSISGFRLGKSDDYYVDWFEINAGFGQICLLLDILRRTFDVTFKNDIQLYPIGHRSYISRNNHEIYPLFRESNDYLKNLKFGNGCRLMLQCIQELYDSQMFIITPITSAIIMAAGNNNIGHGHSQQRSSAGGVGSGTGAGNDNSNNQSHNDDQGQNKGENGQNRGENDHSLTYTDSNSINNTNDDPIPSSSSSLSSSSLSNLTQQHPENSFSTTTKNSDSPRNSSNSTQNTTKNSINVTNSSTKRSRNDPNSNSYQPQLQYQHNITQDGSKNTKDGSKDGGLKNLNSPQSFASTPIKASQNQSFSSPLSQNGSMLYQQPQYDTAIYAQVTAKGGMPISHMMSSQIQPPHIIIGGGDGSGNGGDERLNSRGGSGGGLSNHNQSTGQNNGQSSAPSSSSSSIKLATLPGISLSAQAPPTLFICSINGCELNPESPVVWVNSMRQVLMALFQLMLLAVQRPK